MNALLVPGIALPVQHLEPLLKIVAWIAFYQLSQDMDHRFMTLGIGLIKNTPSWSSIMSCSPGVNSWQTAASDSSQVHALSLVWKFCSMMSLSARTIMIWCSVNRGLHMAISPGDIISMPEDLQK